MKIASLQPFHMTKSWLVCEQKPSAYAISYFPNYSNFDRNRLSHVSVFEALKFFTPLKISNQIHNIYIIVGCWMGLGLAVGLYVFVIINSFTWYR